MAIYLKDGSIFLHIPKTGGSWVEYVLRNLGIVRKIVGHKHADYERAIYPHGLKETIPWVFHALMRKISGRPIFDCNPCIFCFVRHPLSWYESWWKFNQNLGWISWGKFGDPNNWHPCSALNGLGSSDFNKFIEKCILHAPGFVTSLYFRYLRERNPMIGYQESLEDDMFSILTKLGYRVDRRQLSLYGRINESFSAKIVWNKDLRDEVIRLERPILRFCGYLSKDVEQD